MRRCRPGYPATATRVRDRASPTWVRRSQASTTRVHSTTRRCPLISRAFATWEPTCQESSSMRGAPRALASHTTASAAGSWASTRTSISRDSDQLRRQHRSQRPAQRQPDGPHHRQRLHHPHYSRRTAAGLADDHHCPGPLRAGRDPTDNRHRNRPNHGARHQPRLRRSTAVWPDRRPGHHDPDHDQRCNRPELERRIGPHQPQPHRHPWLSVDLNADVAQTPITLNADIPVDVPFAADFGDLTCRASPSPASTSPPATGRRCATSRFRHCWAASTSTSMHRAPCRCQSVT